MRITTNLLRHLILILAICSAHGLLKAQKIIDTKQYNDLKGDISKVVETHYTVRENFGEVEKKEVMFSMQSVLNEELNIIELNVIGNSSYNKYAYEFNDDGQPTKFSWQYNDEKTPAHYMKYAYLDGKLRQAEHFEQSVNYGVRLYPNITEIEGEYLLKSRVEYTYDDFGHVIHENHFGISKFDNGPYVNYYESLVYVSEWMYRSYLYETNSRQNVKNVEKEIALGEYTRGNRKYTERFTLTEKSRKYEYDDSGNWTTCTYWNYEKPYKMVQRKIYYK